MEPTVSVIIPVYNGERTIKACVDSFLRQTCKDLEIILVDDGSTDGTYETAKALEVSDSRVTLLRKENGGPASARNLGLARARGTFLCFADCDDSVDEKFVETLLAGIRQDCDLSVCGFFVQKAHGEPVAATPQGSGVVSPEFLKTHMFTPQDRAWGGFVWNKLYKTAMIREHLVSFPEEHRVFEDVVFNYRYLTHCRRVFLCQEPRYCYHIHSGSLTKKVAGDASTVEKWLSYGDAFDCIIPLEQDETLRKLLTMQKVIHIATAVRVLHGCGKGNHRKCREKQAFLRRFLGQFLKDPSISGKKRIGAALTAVCPKFAFALWKRGETV